MFLSSGDLYLRYRPAACDLRLYLYHKGTPAAAPSAYEEVVRRLGRRYEAAHLASFPEVVDLTKGTSDDAARANYAGNSGRRACHLSTVASSYRPLAGHRVELGAAPDLLIHENGSYVIRDVKMSRRINEKDHPEILWQLRLYGRVYEDSTGQPPRRSREY